MKKKLRVGLIYGGKSGEHEVSLQTAKAVIGAFDFTRYEVVPFYITPEGRWRRAGVLTGPVATIDELRLTGPAAQSDSAVLAPIFASVKPALRGGAGEGAVGGGDGGSVGVGDDGGGEGVGGGAVGHGAGGADDACDRPIDVVFPLLHGTNGEDGTIQGLLEIANIPYVGAGVLASAVGMDKVMMKKIFAQEGLPQCVYRYFTRKQWEQDPSFFLMEIEITLGYPCFVKPANLGSSVGVSKAKNREELIRAVEYAFRFDRKVIVEEFVDAREIEVSVLGNDEPRASVPGEIVSSGDFYDYRAKYIDGKSTMIIPAELPAALSEEIRSMAIRAFRAIDASGLSRVDFFVRRSDSAVMINEINTMPGFTPFSMYPLLWRESGLSYGELLDELIRLALERYNEKQQLTYGNE
jgi:D-alanine-D-alanine ligase